MVFPIMARPDPRRPRFKQTLIYINLHNREPRSFKRRQNFESIVDSVEEYARCWTKSEGEELTLCMNGSKVFENY
jgi:hypothetical protein